jgi:hypothetical protein
MRTILISFLILLLALSALGQHPNVMISNQNGCNEPSIIINPKNTDQLYAGTNLNNVYYSEDGGFTWIEEQLYSPQYGVWGDPVLICDTAGAFYYFHLSNPVSGNWIDRIVCQKVDYLGGEWNDGTYMGLNGSKAQDKEWAVVNRENNHIFVTWTQFDDYGTSNPNYFSNIMFSKSLDGGMTWSPAIQINEVSGDCVDSDNTTEGAVPAIGPGGEIYVAWAGPVGLVFDRSLDEGETWLTDDIFVADIGGGWDYDIPGIMRANGLPVTVCDTSGGPYNGNIYINWSDQSNGPDDTDIWLVKSIDGGDTWSDPVRINDDPPGRHQFFTWMTIDQATGYLWFVFYDRRNHTNNMTDVYMAYSTDGGETFVNFKVSDMPFLPISSIFFGDYTNVTAHDNVIRPIWTRLQNGQRSTWTAMVNPLIVGVEDIQPVIAAVELYQNYPNPFEETTHISFKLKRTARVNLAVYDQLGRRITTLIDGLVSPGKHVRHFDATEHELAPGIYYFSLVSEQMNLHRKMIIE